MPSKTTSSAENASRAASRPEPHAHCAHCGTNHRVLTDDQCLDRSMSEKTLQNRVIARARKRGWRVAHAGRGWVGGDEEGAGGRVVTQMARGWPDLFLLHAGVYPHRLAMELKRELGVVDEEQQDYLDLMNACGIPAVVIRPSDLRVGRVNAILEGN